MLEDFQRLFESQAKVPGIVLHVGAGAGGDLPVYQRLGFKEIYLVEPCEDQVKVLRKKARHRSGVKVIESLVAAENGVFEFCEFSNPSFCGMNLPETIKKAYPNTRLIKKEKRQAITLDELLVDKGFSKDDQNLLVLELMGEEKPLFEALQPEVLDRLDWIVINLTDENSVVKISSNLLRAGYECVVTSKSISPFVTAIFKQSPFYSELEKERLKNEALEKDMYEKDCNIQSCLIELDANEDALKNLQKQEKTKVEYIEYLQHEAKSSENEIELLRAKLQRKEKTQTIIVGTMPRSGSTWLFNCIKEIFTLKKGPLYSSWIKDYDPDNAAEVHVIKAHDPDAVSKYVGDANVIISTRRDIRYVAASLIRMNWNRKEFYDQLDNIVNNIHSYWHARTNMEIEYDQIISSPVSVVEIIGYCLGFHLVAEEARDIAARLEGMNAPPKYDKETQLHPNHRSPVAEHYDEYLDEKTLKFIESQFEDWLTKYCYM